MAMDISVKRRGLSSHLWLIKVSVINVVKRFAVNRVKMVTAKLKSLRYIKRMHDGMPQMYQKRSISSSDSGINQLFNIEFPHLHKSPGNPFGFGCITQQFSQNGRYYLP